MWYYLVLGLLAAQLLLLLLLHVPPAKRSGPLAAGLAHHDLNVARRRAARASREP